MALNEHTRVTIGLGAALGVLCPLLLGWMIYMQLMLFQVKEDVAVIKATVVPPALKVALHD